MAATSTCVFVCVCEFVSISEPPPPLSNPSTPISNHRHSIERLKQLYLTKARPGSMMRRIVDTADHPSPWAVGGGGSSSSSSNGGSSGTTGHSCGGAHSSISSSSSINVEAQCHDPAADAALLQAYKQQWAELHKELTAQGYLLFPDHVEPTRKKAKVVKNASSGKSNPSTKLEPARRSSRAPLPSREAKTAALSYPSLSSSSASSLPAGVTRPIPLSRRNEKRFPEELQIDFCSDSAIRLGKRKRHYLGACVCACVCVRVCACVCVCVHSLSSFHTHTHFSHLLTAFSSPLAGSLRCVGRRRLPLPLQAGTSIHGTARLGGAAAACQRKP